MNVMRLKNWFALISGGPTSKGREGKGEGEGRGGKGRDERGGSGRGGEGCFMAVGGIDAPECCIFITENFKTAKLLKLGVNYS